MKRYQQGKERDYRSKLVRGMIANNECIRDIDVRVRMTSDEKGQTLSLSVEEEELSMLIAIPLEKVRDIIRVTKKGP